MQKLWTIFLTGAAFTLLALTPIVARAQYTFTRIAESNSSDMTVPNSPPAINDAGQVVFTARSGFFQSCVGGVLTTISDTSGRFSNFDIDPRVNAFGQVAFEGDLKSGGSGVFTGNGDGVTTIPDTSGVFQDFTGMPSINDLGEVAFGAELKSGADGIFVHRGGLIQTLVDTSGDFASGLAFGLPTLNDRGQVAFQASLKTGGFGLFVGPDAVKDRVLLSWRRAGWLYDNRFLRLRRLFQ